MADNIFLGSDFKDKLIRGICKTTEAVEGAYGADGYDMMVDHEMYPYFISTNDAKTIVDAVRLEDPIENKGKQVMNEAADRADKDSADGRKTTMILTKAIFLESKDVKGNPTKIRKSLMDCIPIIHTSIDKQKRNITADEVGAVASISAESAEIGKLVQDIYKAVGKDVIIEVEPGKVPGSFYEVGDGVRLRGAKAFGKYAYTEEGKAVFKNPHVLISKDKITSVDQMNSVLDKVHDAGISELVIYCDDIDLAVATRLAEAHMSGAFKSLIIKSPTLWKDWLFEDFAKITGATPIDSKEGMNFKNFDVKQLGTCGQISSDDQETRVVGTKDISEHIAHLKSLNSDDAKIRISWLQTKMAVLKIGAYSDTELNPMVKKAKDACAAAYLALKDGVVAGGGTSLVCAARDLPNTIGGNILKKALLAPARQIAINGGYSDLTIGSGYSGEIGFDTLSGSFVNMFDAGIIDPALVLKNAVKNAISIAATSDKTRGIIMLTKKTYGI